jgi:hypothetical protein
MAIRLKDNMRVVLQLSYMITKKYNHVFLVVISVEVQERTSTCETHLLL